MLFGPLSLALHSPTPPSGLVLVRFRKGQTWVQAPERERERESFAFVPLCRVQDAIGCFLGSRGGTSSIRGEACHLLPE